MWAWPSPEVTCPNICSCIAKPVSPSSPRIPGRGFQSLNVNRELATPSKDLAGPLNSLSEHRTDTFPFRHQVQQLLLSFLIAKAFYPEPYLFFTYQSPLNKLKEPTNNVSACYTI
ncbi:114aa long hypothetical protein [Pyrococcus horikoshii OT3]|uniref:Uncharacterized protein n=1 Tax=Pyrococcus horikoshii (strain ATCC 700860 / DSM 12428 / JCM 9974 / NBRC 100139 / OT-3) TaxID=70601 RepID=O57752_PYRHO|nr:114aa long hypothetical protein [Pyrococcus horikoshii OT3]